MEFDARKWLEQFNANYNEASTQAKELKDYVKNKAGLTYIPWATMERMLYQQDPSAEFEVVTHTNEEFGYLPKKVWTDWQEYVVTDANGNQIKSSWATHFVRVSVTFFGKTIIEDYPIQKIEKNVGYTAPKFIDGNDVNKAIQRAKAKAGSRVSGLGLKLYESKDLQFEDDAEPKKTSKGRKQTVEEMKEEIKNPVADKPTSTTAPAEVDATFLKYAEHMKANIDRVKTSMQTFNASIASAYQFTFDIEKDTPNELAAKLGKVKDGHLYYKGILNHAKFTAEEIKKVIKG